MPPITHGQNDVQTILRGTLYPMLYAPDTITILHLNTNNAFFLSFFFFSFFFQVLFFFSPRAFGSTLHIQARVDTSYGKVRGNVGHDNIAAILESP